MSKRKRVLIFLVLLLTDISAYYISFALAYGTRSFLPYIFSFIPSNINIDHDLYFFWFVLVLFIIFLFSKLYFSKMPFWMESGVITRNILLCFFLCTSFVSLAHLSSQVSRLILILLFIYLVFIANISRYLVKVLLFKCSSLCDNAILIASPSRVDSLYSAFTSSVCMGIRIVVKYDCSALTSEAVLNIKKNRYDVAIIMPSTSPSTMEKDLCDYLQKNVARLYVVPDNSLLNITNSSSGQIIDSSIGYIAVENALKSPLSVFFKRGFDLLLAIFLAPFILPLIIILCLMIKVTSKGNAIYKQARVGRNGKLFNIFKLRTMYMDADVRLKKILEDPERLKEWEMSYKLKNDPRVTKLGSFLRKTSLDELPQFINVLKGEMSFVGPRPVLMDEIERYYKDERFYYYMTTPGITGLWQVSGRSDINYEDRVKLDSWYVVNWSLWLDIVIFLYTPFVVFKRKGAY